MLEDRRMLSAGGNEQLTNLFGFETDVAVDPNNPLVVATSQFNQVLISQDGGRNFGAPITVNAPLAGYLNTRGGDPTLSFDSMGNLFFGYLSNNGAPANMSFTLAAFAAVINPLTGVILQNVLVAAETNTTQHDKEWVAADHWAGSPFRDNAYMIWSQLGVNQILFSRTTNGGQTWSAPIQLDPGGQGFVWPAEVSVAPNGDVWVGWHTNTSNTAGNLGGVVMRRSSDGGQTFGPLTTPFPNGTADVTDNAPPNAVMPDNQSWMQGAVQPRILLDPVRPGNVYVISVDDPDNNYAMGDPADIVMARSTDYGATWTRSTISHGPANTMQSMPTAAIDEDGNISVTWYDARNGLASVGVDQMPGTPDDNVLLDLFATVSLDGGVTFSQDFRINENSFDPDLGPPTDRFPPNNVFRIGEYNGHDADSGYAFVSWTANNGSNQDIAFDIFSALAAFPDPYEDNDIRATATYLGSPEFTTLDATIHPSDSAADVDFYRYVAHFTGKLVIELGFFHEAGDLDLQVQDRFGNVIAISNGTVDNEKITIPVIQGQNYFVRVNGANGNTNHYTLEIQNYPAPAPTGVHLDPASDTGLSNHDGVTSDTTPTLFIQTDVLEFIDANGNGLADAGEIAALTAAQAAAGTMDGVAVEVTLANTTTGTSTTAFANPIIATIPEVYTFTPAAALTPGVYLVTARLKVFDGQRNAGGAPAPAMGRSTASPPLWITIDLAAADVLGPQITNVTVNNFTAAQYDLFAPKPTTSGPTPLVNSLRIAVQDLPNRIDAAGTANDFLAVALNATVAMAPGNYLLVGDHVGVIAIQSIAVSNDAPANGSPATATIVLNFAKPLPDDRYTLTVRDNLIDPAGNKLDGESNAIEPQESPLFPSGDTRPGGNFVARFTIDSRPEIAAYIPQQITVDVNGNFVWDPGTVPVGGDATNVDLAFTMQVRNAAGVAPGGFGTQDLVFAGRFFTAVPGAAAPLGRFDQLAVYGNAQDLGAFRWLIDLNSDGVVNTAAGEILTIQPTSGLPNGFNAAGAIPVAGNFDGNADNGDEVGLYYAGTWALDTNHNFVISAGDGDTFFYNGLLGHPIVGDFDGDKRDDLAVFNNNTFTFNLANDGLMDPADASLVWGFPGVLDRPVAADMDRDGIDDIGLWVPRTSAQNPAAAAEWYFLLSHDFVPTHLAGSIDKLNHPFTPAPFGFDLYAEFGNERALPLVGNFDPPVAASPATPQITGGAADFDGDADVDGADFLTWQRNLGRNHVLTALGDANGDHLVNGGDLGAWKATFGAHAATSSAATLAAESARLPVADGQLAEFNRLLPAGLPVSLGKMRAKSADAVFDAISAGELKAAASTTLAPSGDVLGRGRYRLAVRAHNSLEPPSVASESNEETVVDFADWYDAVFSAINGLHQDG